MSSLNKAWWARNSRRFHLSLSWLGGIALLVWGLSGITHPIMGLTGPEAAKFFPPKLSANLDQMRSPAEILEQAGITQARIVKVVPSFDGPVLQVTAGDDKARRYFDLRDGRELEDHDKAHAIWLARYYTGLEKEAVTSVRLQDRFDTDYPWVNRLLPVWRIDFDSSDARRAYIYTELNALAAQHDTMRNRWQAIFQALHTWTWLDGFENARVLVVALLMLSLLGMSFTGIAMIFTFKRRKIADRDRRWHRRIAYFIWLPILLLSASGFYHLLQYRFVENTRGLQIGPSMVLEGPLDKLDAGWRAAAKNGEANALSLISGPSGFLYRAELPATDLAKPSREERHRGKPTRGDLVYFDAVTGQRLDNYDRTMARALALRFAGKENTILDVTPVTRFGMNYDFRNKRLPVWQVSLDDSDKRVLFVDTGAGVLVDQSNRLERLEGLSFSLLHKWNFLRPFGSTVMSWTVITVVSLACIFALFGFSMALRNRGRQRARRHQQPVPAPVETP